MVGLATFGTDITMEPEISILASFASSLDTVHNQ